LKVLKNERTTSSSTEGSYKMNGTEEQLSKSVQNPMDNTESDMSYSEYDTHKSDND